MRKNLNIRRDSSTSLGYSNEVRSRRSKEEPLILKATVIPSQSRSWIEEQKHRKGSLAWSNDVNRRCVATNRSVPSALTITRHVLFRDYNSSSIEALSKRRKKVRKNFDSFAPAVVHKVKITSSKSKSIKRLFPRTEPSLRFLRSRDLWIILVNGILNNWLQQQTYAG